MRCFDFDAKLGALGKEQEIRLRAVTERGIPAGLALTSDAQHLYVANVLGQRVAKVDLNAKSNVLDIVDVLRGAPLPDGPVAILDPVGGPIAVALAEQLGERAILITPDQIAGNELARTGDLAPANTRLAQRHVRIERRSIVRAVTAQGVEVDDRFTGERRTIECAAVVDCGFRLPDEPLTGAHHRVGDDAQIVQRIDEHRHRIAGALDKLMGRRIVASRHPHRRAADLPGVVFVLPGFAAGFARRRNRELFPHHLAGRRVERREPVTHAAVAAGSLLLDGNFTSALASLTDATFYANETADSLKADKRAIAMQAMQRSERERAEAQHQRRLAAPVQLGRRHQRHAGRNGAATCKAGA